MEWFVQAIIFAFCPFSIGAALSYMTGNDEPIPKDFKLLMVLAVLSAVVLAIMFERRKGKKS